MSAITHSDNLTSLSTRELLSTALEVKLKERGDNVSLCSIVNAKSGRCSEDCAFCSQSSHYSTEAPVYPLMAKDEIIAAAQKAGEAGAGHFSIVTSGRSLSGDDLKRVADMIPEITERAGIRVCASLGILDKEELILLKEAGVVRYHHNLESSREHFPRVVSTHSFKERTAVIKDAREAGLEVCSGGIIGLGESEDDRLSLARSLAELGVDSVPLNFLIPLAGTPLAEISPLSVRDALRAIAIFRLILPDVPLRLAAGRESVLADFLSTAFMAGADGMMIGGYLTQRGRSTAQDLQFIDDIRRLWNS
ncbi:MAG: biotin synthase BioB [Desulfurivibrionaceae bacterium]